LTRNRQKFFSSFLGFFPKRKKHTLTPRKKIPFYIFYPSLLSRSTRNIPTKRKCIINKRRATNK
jgi:hypothetical protein